MTLRVLPEARWRRADPTPAPARHLRATGRRTVAERQITLAAEGSPIREVFGEDRIGGRVMNVLLDGGYWVVQVLWCGGEIDAINSLTFSDETPPATVLATHYLGTSGQTVDPWMVSAFALKGVTYTDALPGIAYSVLKIPVAVEGWERITAKVRGLHLYDPRTGLTVWSDNPALALARFMVDTVFGCGWTVNWASVTTAANACDALVGTQKRRTIGLTLDTVTSAESWIETLRTYAGCLRPVMRDGEFHLIPDRPAATARTFDHASGQILRISPLRKRGMTEAPTVVTVWWTDTSVTPWRERPATARLPGVLEGTVRRREQEVRLAGIRTYAQALREAAERLNGFTLSDLSFSIDVFDDGLAIEEGDVVAVTAPPGLSAKTMRVIEVTSGSAGRYTLALDEYDPAKYSDAIVAEPTTPDTSLPLPSEPTPPTGLTLSEEVYQLQDGTYASRVAATWTAPSGFPFVQHYRVNVIAAGVVVWTGTPTDTVFRTGSLREGVSYQVDVITMSVTGASSSAVSGAITAAGKQLIPGDVPSLTGFEVGGEVRLSWGAAVDLDIWRYGIGYGAVGVTRANCAVLDVVDSLRLVTREVPAGTWDFLVWAIDSVRNESETPARRTITVTSDAGAFLVDSATFDTPTVSNMVEYQNGRTDTSRRWVTDNGVAFGTKFSNAMSTYTNALNSYGPVASSWTSESEDFGSSITGNWRGELTATAITGSVTKDLQLGPDGTAWTSYTSLVAKTGARFARLKASGGASDVISVVLPTASVRIDAIARTEPFSVTTLSSGGALVQLANEYVAVKAITPASQASTARMTTYDRVLVAPATGLQFEGVVIASGSNCRHRISDGASRVVQSGDYLEYDFFGVNNPSSANAPGGIAIICTDGAVVHDLPTVAAADTYDANGTGPMNAPYVSNPIGQWISRKHPISVAAGKTIAQILLRFAASDFGQYKVVYRNIRITDGAGTIRLQIWSSGEPSQNVIESVIGQSNIQCGPANSFLAYQFDAAGTQVAGAASGIFNGI